MNKLVTVTLNPAIDLTGHLEKLSIGEVNRIDAASQRAAGKGINVALVARQLGIEVTVTGILGRQNEHPFTDLFEISRLKDAYLREEGSTRINVKLSDDGGRTTDINFPGLEIKESTFEALEERLILLCKTHDLFVLTGSLPESLSPKSWAELIVLLKAENKTVFLDTSGLPLAKAVAAKPDLIKPNEKELLDLFSYDASEDQADIAKRAIALGIANVVVSSGERGVTWYTNDNTFTAVPPIQPVISTVGAGDSLLAALAVGWLRGDDRAENLRRAAAIAAHSVTQVGVNIPQPAVLAELTFRTELVHHFGSGKYRSDVVK